MRQVARNYPFGRGDWVMPGSVPVRPLNREELPVTGETLTQKTWLRVERCIDDRDGSQIVLTSRPGIIYALKDFKIRIPKQEHPWD